MKLLQQFSDELESLVSKAAPAVVAVQHARGHGTGLFLTPDGYILTNHHADPHDVRVGQMVMAIGNPFRLEQSVSLGVVSAINRTLPRKSGPRLRPWIRNSSQGLPG